MTSSRVLVHPDELLSRDGEALVRVDRDEHVTDVGVHEFPVEPRSELFGEFRV